MNIIALLTLIQMTQKRGVPIYARKMLKIEEVKLDVEDHQDHAWIDIKTANGDSILCGCVYRSP